MMAPGLIQTTLCATILMTVFLEPLVQYRIYRHLRRHHRKVFDRLQISGPSFLWREDRDVESTAFDQLFSLRKHESLNDPQLNRLCRCARLIRWVFGASLALLLIVLVVFRVDPGVRNFLIDLG